MEQCDSVQGLVMHSSLVGGSGSGLMTLLLEKLGFDYGKKLKIINNVLYASNKQSVDTIVEPYNVTLAS